MAASFAAGEATPAERLGFDDAAVPPWIMVPMQGTRLVVLKSGNGLSFQLRNAPGVSGPVVKFQEQAHAQGRGVLLTPISPGTVFLEAKDTAGGVQASLEITVKQRKRLVTHVLSVFDKSHRGPIGLADQRHAIGICNTIMGAQTNVDLDHHLSWGVGLPFDMPTGMPTAFPEFEAPKDWLRQTPGPLPCISSQSPGLQGNPIHGIPFCPIDDSERLLESRLPPDKKPSAKKFLEGLRQYQIMVNIAMNRDAVADYTIFFVRAFDQGGGGGTVTRGFTPPKANRDPVNLCFVSTRDGQTLAHELGHFLLGVKQSFLNGSGHSSGQDDLMFDNGHGIKIPKVQANAINKSGVP